jgi:uncharacterized protein YecA (UPF0149 family)
MDWKFWKKKETPAADAAPAPPAVSGQPAETATDEPSTLTGFFKKFKNMPQILAAAKYPAVMKKVRELEEKMKADGVDTDDMKAVQAWVEKHKAELMPNQGKKAETFVREEPKLGRNDPCHCGSGKKFKKCHGAEAGAN